MNAKRYWVDGMLYEITDGQRQGGDVVMASDFDRVTAERDAALCREAELQEELDLIQPTFESTFDAAQRCRAERDALQERLNAADQKGDDLAAENKNLKELLRSHVYHVGTVGTQAEVDQLISAINGANND